MEAGILVPLGVFAMVVAIVYLGNRKKERIALIEKGHHADFFQSNKTVNPSLKWGIVLVSLGLGVFLAKVLINTANFNNEEAYFSMLFLFGGVGMLIYYFIERKMIAERDKTELEIRHDTDKI